jgi:glycosyltransferase involved in cell wall biosynthesis
MFDKPLVSVVIPTYNDADVLPRALSSVLEQSYTQTEIIVVDDCSPDNTSKIVQSFDDDRISYIKHSKNMGGSAARNTGIQASSGEFIGFLDSDDRWLGSKLSSQLRELEQRSDEWGAVYCNSKNMSGGFYGIKLFINNILLSHGNVKKEGGDKMIKQILLNNIKGNFGSTLLVKKQLVSELNGFDDSFQRHQDLEFVVRLLKKTKIAFLNEVLVEVNKTYTPNANTQEKAKQKFFKKFDSEFKRLEDKGYSIKGKQHMSLAKSFYREGKFKCGNRHLRQSAVPTYIDCVGIFWAIKAGIVRRIL